VGGGGLGGAGVASHRRGRSSQIPRGFRGGRDPADMDAVSYTLRPERGMTTLVVTPKGPVETVTRTRFGS